MTKNWEALAEQVNSANNRLIDELAESERSRTELIKQNTALAADNERLEAVVGDLPQDAIDGGWTAAGISAYAKSLEVEIAELKAVIKASQEQEPVGKFNGSFEFIDGHRSFGVTCFDSLPPVGARLYLYPPVPAQSPETRSSLPDNVTRVVDASTGKVKQSVTAVAVPGTFEIIHQMAQEFKEGWPDHLGKYDWMIGYAERLKKSESHDRCPSHEPVGYTLEHALADMQAVIDYIDEGEPNIEVIKGELAEIILRLTGRYGKAELHPIHAAYGVQDSGVVDHE